MSEKIEKLLSEIKTLLILQLTRQGMTSEEIGKSLGVGGSMIRNIVTGASKKNGK